MSCRKRRKDLPVSDVDVSPKVCIYMRSVKSWSLLNRRSFKQLHGSLRIGDILRIALRMFWMQIPSPDLASYLAPEYLGRCVTLEVPYSTCGFMLGPVH